MARREDTPIREALTKFLPPARIRKLAREVGAVRRRRKVDIAAFVYSLALGFAVGNRRTFAGLRRSFEHACGTHLVPSSFYDRFTPELTRLMERLVAEALQKSVGQRPRRADVWSRFRSVLATDSTILRLHESLARTYPSIWTHYMPASAKLNVVMNVVGRGAHTVQLAAGSTHDLRLLRCGPWLRGRLLLFDLAYFQGELFTEIRRHGGTFLIRLRGHTNPILRFSRQSAERHLEGLPLRRALPRMKSRTIDFDVELHYELRRGGHRHPRTTLFRLVGVRDPQAGDYRLYLTNADPERLRPEHIAAVYAARWEVELLFRELKVTYRIEQIPTRNRAASETLIYAAILTLLLSRRLQLWMRSTAGTNSDRMTSDRCGQVLATFAHDVLSILVGPRTLRRLLERRLKPLLLHEARDPNLWRLSLTERAARGTLDNRRSKT